MTDATKRATLPERETYLARYILQTLRAWKKEWDQHYPGPFVVTVKDLDFLEERAAKLWEDHQKWADHLRGKGFEVVFQPSRIKPATPDPTTPVR